MSDREVSRQAAIDRATHVERIALARASDAFLTAEEAYQRAHERFMLARVTAGNAYDLQHALPADNELDEAAYQRTKDEASDA